MRRWELSRPAPPCRSPPRLFPATQRTSWLGPPSRSGRRTDRSPLGPVTVRFPAPQTGTDALIAYRDEASGWWLPVATSVDPATGELTAKVDHFSVWSTIRDSIIEVTSQAPGSVQTGASWLEYWGGGRLLGNRGAPPTCSGAMPSWVAAPPRRQRGPQRRADGVW